MFFKTEKEKCKSDYGFHAPRIPFYGKGSSKNSNLWEKFDVVAPMLLRVHISVVFEYLQSMIIQPHVLFLFVLDDFVCSKGQYIDS